MELSINRLRSVNRQIGWQSSIESTDEFFLRMRPVQVKGGNLSSGVNARIRPPGQDDRVSCPSQLAQGFFQLTLYRSKIRLPLASEKIRAVVSESQLVTCHVQ
jgi:hypothetical protein